LDETVVCQGEQFGQLSAGGGVGDLAEVAALVAVFGAGAWSWIGKDATGRRVVQGSYVNWVTAEWIDLHFHVVSGDVDE